MRLLFALLPLLAGCRNPSGPPERGDFVPGRGPSYGGPVVVIGTTIEASSAKPLANVLVRGPGGVETRSDARGRFELRGLALGAEGELVATTDSGLAGRNRLRGLEAGALEVVLYLR